MTDSIDDVMLEAYTLVIETGLDELADNEEESDQ